MRSLITALLFVLAATSSVRAEEKITIGAVPASDFVPLFVAKDKGFLSKQGIDGEITIMPLISYIPAGIVSGSLQIGATTGPIFLQARASGLDLVVVAGASRWERDSQTLSLVVAGDSGIHDAKDLVGKRVAVPGLNSLADLIVRRWLTIKGVEPTSVTEVEVSFPTMGDLLRNHQIGAAVVIEPFRDVVISSHAGVRLADVAGEVDPSILAAFYIADRKWASAHSKEIAGFRAALRQGIDTFLHDPEGRTIEAKYLKVNSKVLPTLALEVTPADLQFHQQLAKQFKLIDGDVDTSTAILP